MTTNSKSYLSKVLACSVMAMLVSGCGLFEGKKKSKSSDPAPVVVDTTVTPTETPAANGGVSVALKFGSTAADAKYKCLIEPVGAPAQGANNWIDCQDRLDIPAGVQVKLAVKAVNAAGVEDKEPAVLFLPLLGATVERPTIAENASTEILGKSEIGAVYFKELLKLTLAVRGGDPAQYRYECKRETEQQFRLCNRDGSNGYDFGKLLHGQEIALSVRAVHNQSGVIAAEDSLAFKVSLTMIEGAEALQDAKTGEVPLRIRLGSGEIATCEVRRNGREDRPFACNDGVTLPLTTMAQGSYTLVVVRKTSAGEVLGTENINFCARQCGGAGAGPGGGQAVELKPQRFLIGNFYEFTVPEGMHVTEYSTTKTYNRQLSFYRVLSEFDPHYIGNSMCNGYADRRITALTPRGEPLDYCHSTVQDDIYKWMTDYRLANNHIEVATDGDIVAQNPAAHQRIMINVFDADYEFQRSRTRFEYLCMNRPIVKGPPMRFLQNFWAVDEVWAEFWMCDTDLPGTGPGLPGIEQWRVGAFFIVDSASALPDMYCTACSYSTQKAIEVVYMARPNESNWRPENFARTAQSLFLSTLGQAQP